MEGGGAEGGGDGGLLGRAAAAACGSARNTLCNNFAMWKEGEATLLGVSARLCKDY